MSSLCDRNKYYIYDFVFEYPNGEYYETLIADIEVERIGYEYGADADGNRGVWMVDNEIDVLTVRNDEGKIIPITDELVEYLQELIDDRIEDLI